MAEQNDLVAFVSRIVERAQIPSRAERDDLRRELLAHFEDAALARGSRDDAVRQFGGGDDIAADLHRIYRGRRARAHTFRIATGLAASLAAALGITVLANRPESFAAMAALACLVAVVFVLCRELFGRVRPRSTAFLSVLRWVMAFVALGAWEYAVHRHAGIPFGALRAAVAGGRLISVAASSALAMAGADRLFRSWCPLREV
jgi:hypothetical protein